MKSLLVALLLCLSTPAIAENWSAVADVDDGDRLLLDIDSLRLFDDKGNTFVEGTFKIYPNDTTMMQVIMDTRYCDKGEGPMMMVSLKIKKHPVATFFYSSSGTKTYDFAGKSLCTFNDAVKANAEEKNGTLDPKGKSSENTY